MDVAERVHLMPVGYENDRIVLSAEQLRADRVVLLEYRDETDHPSYGDTVRDRLEERRIDHETVPCDIFDISPVS